jgi:hypothetical protein
MHLSIYILTVFRHGLIHASPFEHRQSRVDSALGWCWARSPTTVARTMEPLLSPSYKFIPIQVRNERLKMKDYKISHS